MSHITALFVIYYKGWYKLERKKRISARTVFALIMVAFATVVSVAKLIEGETEHGENEAVEVFSHSGEQRNNNKERMGRKDNDSFYGLFEQ